jgi:hypothetical protein
MNARLSSLAGAAALIACAATAVGQSSPQDYPQWRGLRRDGSASGFVAPKSWPETLTRKWKIEIGEGYATPAIRPAKRDDRWTVEPVWETKAVSMYLSNPVIVGDALFGLSHRARGQFFALDAKSGTVLWLGKPREASNTALVKAGDLLFLLNDDAELIVARSSRTGFDPVTRYTVADSATWAQPAILGNRVFVKDVSSLTLWTLD